MEATMVDNPQVETQAVEPPSTPGLPPVSTPGMPVPHAAGPARTPPAPPTTPGAPVQSWLVPATGP
jgi:hypothetical protein